MITPDLLRTDKGVAMVWQTIHHNEKAQAVACARCRRIVPVVTAQRIGGEWYCTTCQIEAFYRLIEALKETEDDPDTSTEAT